MIEITSFGRKKLKQNPVSASEAFRKGFILSLHETSVIKFLLSLREENDRLAKIKRPE